MKRKRSSNPECAALLDPSIADCLSCFPYVWDDRDLQVKTSKGKRKTKTFRRLKEMYQKILWDILDGMVSRLKNGQTVGFLTLQTIKIKDNVAYLPEVSGPEQALWHPAQQYYNVVVALLGTDDTTPELDSFYKILVKLMNTKDFQRFIRGLEALRFHPLLQSSKENNSFIGDALDKLKGIRVPVRGKKEPVAWKEAYRQWSIPRFYNIKAAIQGNSYFLEVYFYHKSYPHSCIGVLNFVKNVSKHLNENRARDGKIEWSEEILENFFDYHFPGEMINFFEFLWYKDLPVNFRNSGKQIPPVYLMQAHNGKVLNLSGVISGTSNDQTTICTHLATGELQTIKNCDLEFIKELGSGTYGTVYHGKWKGSNVAIKKFKPSCFTDGTLEDRLVADFWQEAHVLGHLHHPNIVAFYGVVTDGPVTNLATVTEYMVNGSLKQVLRRKDRTIDRQKRLIIAMDAAFAMEYLHEKNIVHFDLKSLNFLVDMRDPQKPVCKIGNLGLSKIKQRTLVSGGVPGTVPWMAPEILKGHRKHNFVTEKVDVYSFGIVMWELLTGEEPYAALRSEEIIADIIKGSLRPEIPSWCDPTWSSLMERCWSSDPESRPPFSKIAKELCAMSAAMTSDTTEAELSSTSDYRSLSVNNSGAG